MGIVIKQVLKQNQELDSKECIPLREIVFRGYFVFFP